MKSRSLKLLAVLLLVSVASCSSEKNASSAKETGKSETTTPTQEKESAKTETKKAVLKHMYISSQETSYINMRPTYNYMLFGLRYQTLEIYDDNSYLFSVHSEIQSNTSLAETGNEYSTASACLATQNFYGTYTSKVDDLDESTTNYTLESPSRYVFVKNGAQTGKAFLDTDNWTDQMSKEAGTTEDGKPIYTSGKDYLSKAVVTVASAGEDGKPIQKEVPLVWKNTLTISANNTTYYFEYSKEATPEITY